MQALIQARLDRLEEDVQLTVKWRPSSGGRCPTALSRRSTPSSRTKGHLAQEAGDEYGQTTSQINQAIALIILGQAQEALALTAPAQTFFERAGNPVNREICASG